MASGRTARRALDYPLTTDAYKISGDIKALAEQLDNDAETGQGTLAERPVAKTRGRLYYVTGDATAENNNILWWDTGATWVRVSTSGPFSALTLEATVEQHTGLATCSARLEHGGTAVRLRGGVKAKVGKSVAANGVFATVPAQFIPPSTLFVTGTQGSGLAVSAPVGIGILKGTGQVFYEGASPLTEEHFICLDGCTYSL